MILAALFVIITEGNVDRCLHQEHAYDLLVGKVRYHLESDISQNNDKLDECLRKSVPVRIEGRYHSDEHYHIYVKDVEEIKP